VSGDFSIVMTTTDTAEKAQEIARAVVEQGLAACVHIVPLHSVYRWQGSIEQAEEFRLEMKMRTADYAALEAAIRAMHSYETPEIVRVDIAEGYRPYLDWIAETP
jgi:periplasmic divalent cation tolerance protein